MGQEPVTQHQDFSMGEEVESSETSLCPDITPYWQLARPSSSQQRILTGKTTNLRYLVTAAESFALQYFTGKLTVTQVQQRCEKQFESDIPPNFVLRLLEKLLRWGVIVDSSSVPEDFLLERQGRQGRHGGQGSVGSSPLSTLSSPSPLSPEDPPLSPSPSPPIPQSPLKPCLQWIAHPEGYWILRNREDVTFLQVDSRSQQAISLLGTLPPEEIARQSGLSPQHLNYLMQLLAATGMLRGTKPQKPPKKKFHPLQLLFFKVPLFNPDPWLGLPAKLLRGVWTRSFFWFLVVFLSTSAAVGLNLRSEILLAGSSLWEAQGGTLLLPFALLAVSVVTLHEFAHALTLKHYGGIVPEVGFLFMFLMPAAYTNTSDSYCLVKRRQRVFVVGAGVLCQLAIGAMALWLWLLSVSSSWLHPTSYLLLVAALFTIAVNLNPLAKFDGYYLAVALTGINNLRSRSFEFYRNWLTGKPIAEKPEDCRVLAAYAPLSFLYILVVFGSLFFFVTYWIFDQIPLTAMFLLLAWSIYYFFPRSE